MEYSKLGYFVTIEAGMIIRECLVLIEKPKGSIFYLERWRTLAYLTGQILAKKWDFDNIELVEAVQTDFDCSDLETQWVK